MPAIAGAIIQATGFNATGLTASQAVLTDASKNLVSVAYTGTGNVVRSASPTFTGTVTTAAISATTGTFSGDTLIVGTSGGTILRSQTSGNADVAIDLVRTVNTAARWVFAIPAGSTTLNVGITGTANLFTLTTAGAGAFAAGITATTGTFTGGNIFSSASAGSDTGGAGPYIAVARADGTRYATWQLGAANDMRCALYDGSAWGTAISIAQTTFAVSFTGGISATTGTFSGAVSLGNTVNSVSPTSPNRTVTISIGGVTYYIPAKTTND